MSTTDLGAREAQIIPTQTLDTQRRNGWRAECRPQVSGAAVFIPGPLKALPRCQDKINNDYAGVVPYFVFR